jgi:hypothetical protein
MYTKLSLNVKDSAEYAQKMRELTPGTKVYVNVMRARTHTHTCAHTRTNTYTHTHEYTHAYTHTHTHTHTDSLSLSCARSLSLSHTHTQDELRSGLIGRTVDGFKNATMQWLESNDTFRRCTHTHTHTPLKDESGHCA